MNLSVYRDFLSVGLNGAHGCSIELDSSGDRLILNVKGKRSQLFSRTELEDNSYKGKFADRLREQGAGAAAAVRLADLWAEDRD